MSDESSSKAAILFVVLFKVERLPNVIRSLKSKCWSFAIFRKRFLPNLNKGLGCMRGYASLFDEDGHFSVVVTGPVESLFRAGWIEVLEHVSKPLVGDIDGLIRIWLREIAESIFSNFCCLLCFLFIRFQWFLLLLYFLFKLCYFCKF